MLKLFSCLLITVTFPISMGYTLRTVQEYERGVIFRMGRLKKKSTIGPGMYFIIPCIDKVKVQFNTIFFFKNCTVQTPDTLANLFLPHRYKDFT